MLFTPIHQLMQEHADLHTVWQIPIFNYVISVQCGYELHRRVRTEHQNITHGIPDCRKRRLN